MWLANNKYEKINYRIYPFSTMNITLGTIGSITTIYVLIKTFKGFWLAISVMALIILLLAVLLIRTFFRFKTTKEQYNHMVDKINYANDNRDTLSKMIEEKNEEINIMENDIYIYEDKIRLLFQILYTDKITDRKDIKEIFDIKEEVIDNEKK